MLKLNVGAEIKEIRINPIQSEKSLIVGALSTDKKPPENLMFAFS